MDIVSYSLPDVTIDKANQDRLTEKLMGGSADIVCAGQLFIYWSNDQVKKHIYFEHYNGSFEDSFYPPPDEPAPFAKVRWNPFNSYVLIKKSVSDKLKLNTNNPETILKEALASKLKIMIYPEIIAHKKLTLKIYDYLNLNLLIKKKQFIRNNILSIKIVLVAVRQYIREQKNLRVYLDEIIKIKENKEIVLSFNFGGLGDCLVYSSLPRLLSERYGVNFYLDESVKKLFRHQDIADVCFEQNPYFKGYKKVENPFRFKQFISNSPWKTIITERGKPSAIYQLEKQFGVLDRGLPEINYKPKKIPDYEKVLLCDKTWFSGQKWGLYNDPVHLEKVTNDWLNMGNGYRIEYIEPQNQDIYTYIDKIYSSGKFVCYFSGGNNVAAALDIPATVIVPENLEGTALSMFLYTKSKIKYLRTKSLEAYL